MSLPKMESTSDASEIRPYRDGDGPKIIASFRRVFPSTTRTYAEWEWQFALNPAGIRIHLAVASDGTVLAQFAGMPRRVSVRGETRVFTEMVDSFVTPEGRAGLRRPTLFARTVNRYVARHGNPSGDTLMYGIPNEPAFRIGNRFLGYVPIFNVDGIMGRCSDASSVAEVLGGLRLEEVTAWPLHVDALWMTVMAQHDVITIRDHAYLTWRWVRRPHNVYRRYLLKESNGELAGLFVLLHRWNHREGDPPVTVVAEWMADRTRPACRVLPELIRALGREAGADHVRFHFRPNSPEALHLSEFGYEIEPSGRTLVGGTYDSKLVPLHRLSHGWSITPGDFDIV